MARLARSSALQFGVQALQTVIGFVATLYFARVLGSELLGKYFLTLALVNWLLLPTSGLQKAVTKRVSEEESPHQFYTAGFITQSVLAAGLTFLLFLGTNHINNYTGYDAILFVVGLFVLKSFVTFYLNLLRADKRYTMAAGLEGAWHTSRPIAQAALVLTGFGFLSLLWGEAVSMIFALVIGIFGLTLTFSRPRWLHFRSLYDYAKYSWFSALRIRSYSWMDVLILGLFVVPGQIGVYEVAWRISAAFILLPTALSKIVFPHMSNRATQDDIRGVVTTLRRALYFAGALSIPGVVGAYVIGLDILRLYGDEFTVGTTVLVVLSLARVVQSYEVLLLQTLDALDFPELTFRIAIVFTAANLVMNVVLAWWIGPVGAAIATAASVGLSTYLAYRYLGQKIDFGVRLAPFAAQLFAALSMGVVVWQLDPFLPENATGTVILVFVGVAVYGLLLIASSGEIRSGVRRIIGAVSESTA